MNLVALANLVASGVPMANILFLFKTEENQSAPVISFSGQILRILILYCTRMQTFLSLSCYGHNKCRSPSPKTLPVHRQTPKNIKHGSDLI